MFQRHETIPVCVFMERLLWRYKGNDDRNDLFRGPGHVLLWLNYSHNHTTVIVSGLFFLWLYVHIYIYIGLIIILAQKRISHLAHRVCVHVLWHVRSTTGVLRRSGVHSHTTTSARRLHEPGTPKCRFTAFAVLFSVKASDIYSQGLMVYAQRDK